MEKKLKELSPQPLWDIFEEICHIPHPSKKEEKIIAYVKNFGEELGLSTSVDSAGNVLIRKPATPGFENRKTIVLQSHLDMVPQKNNDTRHDFENDAIQPYIDEVWVKAKGTTLGADNGIGASAALAILKSDGLHHGPLECLFTIDEETGMTGAFALEKGFVTGDILLNMDSEDEGELYIGCAGGIDTSAYFGYEESDTPGGYTGFRLEVKGLKGGHSGLDINTGRGNANKILNRLLYEICMEDSVLVGSVNGGTLRNAIPREAHATLAVRETNLEKVKITLDKTIDEVVNELKITDPGLTVSFEPTATPSKIADLDASRHIIKAIYGCPNGVIRMVPDMPDVVETSTNLAIVEWEGGKAKALSLQRSSVDSAKDDLCKMIKSVFELAGAKVEHSGNYPGWKPNIESPVLKTMKQVYNQKYGKNPEVKVIHAGLECGIIGSKYPQLDMISFGPTIRNPHSPDEMVNIKTVSLFWDFLLETLIHAPVK